MTDDKHSDEAGRSSKRKRLAVAMELYHPPFVDEETPPFVDEETPGEEVTVRTIHVLSDGCLDMILSYFNTVQQIRLSLVCRRWYNLCVSRISRIKHFKVSEFKEQLRSELCVDEIKKIRSKAIISVLSLNCGILTSLSLSDLPDLNFSCLHDLGDLLPNLTELEISGDCEIDSHMRDVIRNRFSAQLKCLSLDAVCVAEDRIVNELIIDCENLEHLCIQYSGIGECDDHDDDINGYFIPMVLSTSNPMKSFTISAVPKFKLVNRHVVEFILRNFPATLEYLNLSYSTPNGYDIFSGDPLPELDKMRIFSASTADDFRCERLPISELKLITSQLVSILKLMPNLRVLNLDFNYFITFSLFDIISALSHHCPMLEELNLSNCWILPKKLLSLQKLKFLKRLRLDHQVGYNKDLPKHNLIASFQTVASSLPCLKQLQYLTMMDGFNQLNVEDIVLFFSNAGPNFKGLALSASSSIDGIEKRAFVPKYNFIEEALKKCTTLSRPHDNRIDLVVDKVENLHETSCYRSTGPSCSCQKLKDHCSFYRNLAPDFIRFRDISVDSAPHVSSYSDEHFALNSNKFLNGRIACQYVQVPNVTV